MRPLILIVLLALGACGKGSFPEGRMQMRTEKLQAEIDSLKIQNRAILDSLSMIDKTLRDLKGKDQ